MIPDNYKMVQNDPKVLWNDLRMVPNDQETFQNNPHPKTIQKNSKKIEARALISHLLN